MIGSIVPAFRCIRLKDRWTDDCIKLPCYVRQKRYVIAEKTNVYDKASFIYGISCERCHGPLRGTCRSSFQCFFGHGGLRRSLKSIHWADNYSSISAHNVIRVWDRYRSITIRSPTFRAKRWRIIAKNFYNARPNANLDVHSNQYGLLKKQYLL